jgi:surface polysaccharide O-acyltransferase-like enzyme
MKCGVQILKCHVQRQEKELICLMLTTFSFISNKKNVKTKVYDDNPIGYWYTFSSYVVSLFMILMLNLLNTIQYNTIHTLSEEANLKK